MSDSTVSIRELKSHLSHYLRLARGGESVVITDRGVPVGRLVPIGQTLESRVDALRESGMLRWSGRRLTRRKPTVRIAKRGKTVADLVIEDRG